MRRIRAFVPYSFFDQLYPYNMQPLDSNALALKACGAQPKDGSILRSKEYLLFGNGIGTLIPWVRMGFSSRTAYDGFAAELSEECDKRGVRYWKLQCTSDQSQTAPCWRLRVTSSPPDPDDEGHIISLLESTGSPGQYIFLSCTA